MKFNWQSLFKEKFIEIGKLIKNHDMRITMHPGQYTVINSIYDKVFLNSINDLKYHVELLDLMQLDKSAKVQIHVGGTYGDKEKSKIRFVNRYLNLDDKIKNRLVIENDDKSYSLQDCIEIYKKTQIPVIFDVYHHECLNFGESIDNAFKLIIKTWSKADGLPIVHYSSEHPEKGKPSHAESIDIYHFQEFLTETKHFNYDLMLEIKNKEESLITVKDIIQNDIRYNN
jgi:UV DNA damage endonuclease